MDARKLERATWSASAWRRCELALRAPQRFEALALLNTTADSAGLKKWLEVNFTAITTRI
jgi:hypothetical protein